jgi:transposase-like protein
MSGGAQAAVFFEPIRLLAASCASSADFARSFGTEAACEAWLKARRWPRGCACPRCGRDCWWSTERRGYVCPGCRKFQSLTAGTVLEGTRKPLHKWFQALFLVVQRGVNARTLQREIGLTYKVAWTWGHKLRWLLGPHAVPAEVRPHERAHVRYDAERSWNGPRPTLPHPETPGPCGCTRLLERDWFWENEMTEEEDATRLLKKYAAGHSYFKLWPLALPPADAPHRMDVFAHWELLATYWGSVSERHLRVYLDELAFRFNRRRRSIDESFLLVVDGFSGGGTRTYKQIVARAEPTGHPLSIFSDRGDRSRSP